MRLNNLFWTALSPIFLVLLAAVWPMWKALSILNLTVIGLKAQKDRQYNYNLIFRRIDLNHVASYKQ